MKYLKKSLNIAFTIDGILLATTSSSSVSIWNTADAKELIKVKIEYPAHVSFSPNNQLLVVKNTLGNMYLVRVADGKIISNYNNQLDGEGGNVHFSNCGEYLVDCSWTGFLNVRNSRNRKMVFKKQFSNEMLTTLSKSNDGSTWLLNHSPRFIPGSDPNLPTPPSYLSLWKWPFAENEFLILPFRFPRIFGAALDNSISFLAANVIDTDGKLRLVVIDLKSLQIVFKIEIENTGSGTGNIVSWGFTIDLIGTVQNEKVIFYSFPSGNILKVLEMPFPSSVAFSPMNQKIALGSWKKGLLCDISELNDIKHKDAPPEKA